MGRVSGVSRRAHDVPGGLLRPVARLAGLAGLALLGALLGWVGAPAWGRLPSLAAVAGAALLGGLALLRRARRVDREQRRPWLLLAAALALECGWLLLPGSWLPATRHPANPAHLLAGVLAVAALLRLPAPPESRRGRTRTAMDVAAAALALAVPSWELLDRSAAPLGLVSQLESVAHPLVNVAVATAAIAVLARARRAGGPHLAVLLALGGGVSLWTLADVSARTGAPAGLVAGLLALGGLALAFGARWPDQRTETERVGRWREVIAVLTPLAPLSAAAAVLLGSTVFGAPLEPVTLLLAVLLAATLVSGGVLARLDSLGTERTLDDLVLKRTITLGTREKWFRSLVQNSSDVITVVDVRGVVRYQTPSVARVLGHDPHLLVGTRMSSLLRPADGRRLEAALVSAARNPGRPITLELAIWHKSGRWCDSETTITSLVHDPDIRGLVLNTRDVSERRRLQEQLTQQAYSDALTGLANRALFRSRVEDACDAAWESGQVAVLFLDLDGFKAVNDAHGHHVGDELLGLVAKRLTHSVRPGDVVARLGGDEFAILVSGEDAEEGAIWVAERVRRSLGTPFSLEGRELKLGASTGIAVSDSTDQTADQLLRNADLAMYRAKGRRDLAFVRFEAQMHDALLARMQAEADLRQAVAGGDLLLYYQPVVELTGLRIVGVEALVRWKHDERGIISPSEFIDLAEETGLVSDIGAWALGECTRQGARWQRFAPPGDVFKVAVNVSARQLDAGLPRLVRDAIVSSGVPGSAITLEMTESVLMDRTDEVVELLRRMKTMGVKVAVDDFGTGYSSLSYLSRFPVDILKIDRAFVQHLGSDEPGQGELVGTIVRLGQSLRLETVAEGIETEAQRDVLRELGCTYGQGFLFARPMPPDEIDALLEAQAVGRPAPAAAS